MMHCVCVCSYPIAFQSIVNFPKKHSSYLLNQLLLNQASLFSLSITNYLYSLPLFSNDNSIHNCFISIINFLPFRFRNCPDIERWLAGWWVDVFALVNCHFWAIFFNTFLICNQKHEQHDLTNKEKINWPTKHQKIKFNFVSICKFKFTCLFLLNYDPLLPKSSNINRAYFQFTYEKKNSKSKIHSISWFRTK